MARTINADQVSAVDLVGIKDQQSCWRTGSITDRHKANLASNGTCSFSSLSNLAFTSIHLPTVRDRESSGRALGGPCLW
eukprot:3420534-Amphidinium_carterae.4